VSAHLYVWTDRVHNEVLHAVKEKTNILHTIKRSKTNWFCQILRRTCFLKHFIDGKIEGKEREGDE
jgi:hypothetical protein